MYLLCLARLQHIRHAAVIHAFIELILLNFNLPFFSLLYTDDDKDNDENEVDEFIFLYMENHHPKTGKKGGRGMSLVSVSFVVVFNTYIHTLQNMTYQQIPLIELTAALSQCMYVQQQ